MKNIIKTFMLVALIAMTSTVALTSTVQANDTLTWSNKIMGQGSIYEVIDGDTVWVNVSDASVFNKFYSLADTRDKKKALRKRYKAVKMRIANIDTPESVHRDASRNTKKGKEASNYLKSLASKKYAKFVCWSYAIGRPVCSVEFSGNNGYVDIGFRMITKGYSDYVTAWGKHPYAHDDYKSAR